MNITLNQFLLMIFIGMVLLTFSVIRKEER